MNTLRKNRGFTLVEMLVVLGIMVILTSLILARSSAFSSATLLEGIAYEVALSIREAQVYGVSVKESPQAGVTFNYPYGIEILSTSPMTYTLYADGNTSNSYDSSLGELVKTYTLPRGYSFTGATYVSGGTTLSTSPWCVNILFVRPNPDAVLRYGCPTGSSGSRITLTLSSDAGATRSIIVESTGQISVQ